MREDAAGSVRPLGEIDGLLERVIEGGHAKVAALLIGEEPNLLEGIDLPQNLSVALGKGWVDMAGLLSSIMEQKELLGMDQNRPARSRPVAARL